ncbi:MAG: hypothetical protein KA954_11825 [Chitinophagales bacterium]|nr:hypothetical protein [Bacteroidota bacterium]MBP7400270.1 hypothetical protein [Chitinophagales bacterium]MBK8681457.1 hypothetical protein [Bacteroidota bacterium]MBP9188271.1 hypothetical protein [Chitinophagales bacterium]MBP9547902.1 hypothetical protein [Chitinophagales bacterium]
MSQQIPRIWHLCGCLRESAYSCYLRRFSKANAQGYGLRNLLTRWGLWREETIIDDPIFSSYYYTLTMTDESSSYKFVRLFFRGNLKNINVDIYEVE